MVRLALITFVFFTVLTCANGQWKLQDGHTTADLRGIHFVGDGIVWASGSRGTVLRSEDQGSNWHLCSTPRGAEELDFRGIQAFDSFTAIVMSSGKGELSRLYKTIDGCQTWNLGLTNPDKDGFWDAISMNAPSQDAVGSRIDYSHARGYLLGDPVSGTFSLFSTSDGGNTWSRMSASRRGARGEGCQVDTFPARRDEAIFAASNESLVSLNGSNLIFVTGGSVARIGNTNLDSVDGAFCHQSAHLKELPIAHGKPSSGAFAIAIHPRHPNTKNFPHKAMIVGGDFKLMNEAGGNAVFVSGVGRFAQRFRKPSTAPHGYRSAVAYDETHKAWITVGPNGTDVSIDDGKNWHSLKPTEQDVPDADQHWNSLSLPFAVGPHGRIGLFETSSLK